MQLHITCLVSRFSTCMEKSVYDQNKSIDIKIYSCKFILNIIHKWNLTSGFLPNIANQQVNYYPILGIYTNN